jgi:hypothetical protein
MQRLEDQIEWYDSRSLQNQRIFKVLKMVTILSAALIPFLVGLNIPQKLIIGGLGVLIAVMEGLQQVNQYHSNWITYRSTCEALKHEKFLYLAKAGPYAAATDAHVLLAKGSRRWCRRNMQSGRPGKNTRSDPKNQTQWRARTAVKLRHRIIL